MDPTQIPLRDLHLPDTVGWWPLAPGWWILAALALAGIGWLVRRYLAAHARGAARRHALQRLQALTAAYEEHRDAVRFSAELSALLRRTMLAYAPRREIAGLTGDAWLAWLDRDFDRPRFRTGTGRKLLALPYRRHDDDLAAMDIVDVVALVRQRLATPVGGRR
jgi:hypothetical protein